MGKEINMDYGQLLIKFIIIILVLLLGLNLIYLILASVLNLLLVIIYYHFSSNDNSDPSTIEKLESINVISFKEFILATMWGLLFFFGEYFRTIRNPEDFDFNHVVYLYISIYFGTYFLFSRIFTLLLKLN